MRDLALTGRNGVERPGIIKSIQRGTLTIGAGVTSATVTLTAVDVNNTVIRNCGDTSTGYNDLAQFNCLRLELTNSTTLTGYVNSSTYVGTISYEVIEYWPGIIRSVQRGTTAFGTSATINTVNLSLATLDNLGWTSTQGSIWNINARLAFASSTSISCTGSQGIGTCGYQAVDWF